MVHVAGSLGVSTAPVLRTTVLECLATEPAHIVLDVAELRAHDDVALTVLPPSPSTPRPGPAAR
ncbi:hypothetical protein GCM10027610_104050 [Dactylosporangium cerinum]